MAQFTPGPTSFSIRHGRVSQFTVAGYTNTFTVHADFQDTDTQTAFMLIDMSDTTNWPHSETNHCVLEYLILEVDPETAFLGEIKIGFLTDVNATDGDFNQIIDIDLAKKSAPLVEVINFGSHGLHCVSDHHFGPILANSALFQTDVSLEGPDNATSYPSGDGDLILLIEVNAGAVDVSITLGYETVT